MRISSIIMAIVGLGVAGGSAQLAREMLTAPQAAATATPELVYVVTAASEIRRGEEILAHMLTTQAWPGDAVPAGVFLDRAALLPTANGQPRRATRPMVAGELVLNGKVSDFGEKVTIAQSLSPGTRAMAIKVDAVTAVGGFVTPGDSVDLLLTRGRGEELMADTILRNIRVIGVDQKSDELNDRPDVAATVTVEVTAEQGQVIALAQRAGTLSLALRNGDGDDSMPLERLRLSDLVPEPVVAPAPEPEAAPVAPPARTMIVRRGVETEEVTLRN
ncbi:Flp pilus assembly protein CpaB [Yoonia sp.]|uniref:Flp pilus assembly protein CpaB n=1 Tax=Yoonia sp. TaxID=2212373 RepID=UPI0019F5C2DD|nr:Flp pilus assembly protein CpaB [Yoonia sp.]MBE0413735.1 Flp pilus assembly protein CpaB [Yoonia sp.]